MALNLGDIVHEVAVLAEGEGQRLLTAMQGRIVIADTDGRKLGVIQSVAIQHGEVRIFLDTESEANPTPRTGPIMDAGDD